VYALAEFIDNSLRATRRNAPNPRNITIAIHTTGSGPSRRGLVCVSDNGCGMTKHELNDWAVMNYSMEERGTAPKEPEAAGRGSSSADVGAGRFLSGDLSFFGVGSKNAAFFIGSDVKVVTRKTGERYVHELCLAANELEERYRNHESVYEGDMVHRNPGDASTVASMEQPFTAAKKWVLDETQSGNSGTESSFTRVIIGNLKMEILEQLSDDIQGTHLCRELAHLYHYYLHGDRGNREPSASNKANGQTRGSLPNGEPLPLITLSHAADAKVLWERRLTDVGDDFESRILQGQRSELTFSLQVPQRGTVSGVLYYFPYENDKETVPTEDTLHSVKPDYAPFAPAGPTQATAAGGGTQFGARATQGAPNGSGNQDDCFSDDEGGGLGAWSLPIFEAFWQGRLIPGARIESLPFIEAVRQRRNAAAKDAIPDEVFHRLRGALFFGPGFRVTRNK